MSIIEELIPRAYAVAAITPVGTANPRSSADAKTLLSRIGDQAVDILFLIGGILAVIYLLWAGVQYITAGGSPDKAKAARQAIINAVIGIIIMMAAFAIIRFATAIGSWVSKTSGTSGSSSSSNTPGSGSGSTTTGTTSSSSTTSSTTGTTTGTTSSSSTTSSTTGTTGSTGGNISSTTGSDTQSSGNSGTQVRP